MKKHLPPLLWILGGILFCVFLVFAKDPTALPMTRHLFFYGSLAVVDGGCLAKTILNRHVNSSVTNFGFKLMAVGTFFLLILVSFARACLMDAT